MSNANSGQDHPDLMVYKIESEDGHRYVVYNAKTIGNPSDHTPNKWYFRPYPARFPLGDEVGEPFDTAEDAERAARTRPVQGGARTADALESNRAEKNNL